MKYVNFSKLHLQFFYRQCIGSGDRFNLLASLARIAALEPDVGKMQAQLESELNLLQFYRVVLPDVVPVSHADVSLDQPATELLREHIRWLLEQYVPAYVGGNGNCFFSRGEFGSLLYRGGLLSVMSAHGN